LSTVASVARTSSVKWSSAAAGATKQADAKTKHNIQVAGDNERVTTTLLRRENNRKGLWDECLI